MMILRVNLITFEEAHTFFSNLLPTYVDLEQVKKNWPDWTSNVVAIKEYPIYKWIHTHSFYIKYAILILALNLLSHIFLYWSNFYLQKKIWEWELFIIKGY